MTGMSSIEEYRLDLRNEEHMKMQRRAEEFLSFAKSLYVDNIEQADDLQCRNQQTYGQMKEFKAYIDEDIKNAMIPVNKLKDKKKTIVGPLDEGTTLINNKIGTFRQAYNALIDKRVKENEAKAMAEQEKTGELVIPDQVTDQKIKANGATKLEVRIVDWSLIPKEWMIPISETAKEVIRKVIETKVRATGTEVVPGCDIIKVPSFRRSSNGK